MFDHNKQPKFNHVDLLQSVLCAVLCLACEDTKYFRISKRYTNTKSFLIHIQKCQNFDHLKSKGIPLKSDIIDAIKKALESDEDIDLEKIPALKIWGMMVP